MKRNNFSTLSLLGLFAVLLFLSGCEMSKNYSRYDRSADKEQQDYRRALSPRPLPKADAEPFIPELESYSANEEDKGPQYPLVSVSVNQTVSLRDLLFELADQAEIDLEMDPQIRGSLIFTVRDRPFDEVIDRIAKMSGLRYRMDDNLLRVELDRPFVHTYKINYLNFVRKVESDIELDVSVISETEAEVGSSSKIETKLESDFWDDLETNVEQILTSSENHITLATLDDPQAQPRAVAAPETVEVLDPSELPPPILQVTAPPAQSTPQLANAPSTYSVNRQAGLVTIFTTERQHKLVSEYLDDLRRISTAQILIEAKILEVSLSDEFATGIDWGDTGFTGLISTASFPRPGLTNAPADAFTATLKIGGDTNIVVDALNQFGTVRALSSPRLTVLNNQSAILNVVRNSVFFEFDVTVEVDDDTGDETREVSTEIRSVPEGVMLNVVPSVNFETGEITLMLRPTVTNIANRIPDPSIDIQFAGSDPATIAALGDVSNLIPELAVQELDSVVKMQSGEVVLMGGLMQDQNQVTETGVPVLGNMPVVGKLFSSQKDNITKSELVIFLKATLVPGSEGIHDVDKELYKNFGQDRRPFRM